MNIQKHILIFGLQPWDTTMGSNCKNLALEFSKQHKVLYVNRPISRFELIKREKTSVAQNRVAVINGNKPSLEQVSPTLWVLTPPIVTESINWIPSYKIFQKFNYWNNYRLARIIKRYLKQLNFKEFVLFNDSSMFMGFYLKELLTPDLFIYYIRDYLISQKYFKAHGKKAEKHLIQKANIVTCNSEYLRQYAEQYNSNAYYVGQGCDLEAFSPYISTERPTYLKQLSKPIIGYVGLLTSRRLNIQLLEQLAANNPQWDWVLVGPEDDHFKQSSLHQLSNVHFLGFQPADKLARYIKGFDVCINPQQLNEMSKGNYPRKIDEYLAMGKPVVATQTPTMQTFKNYVYLAHNVESYTQQLDRALQEDSVTKRKNRIDFAQTHTWKNSADLIIQHIYKTPNYDFS
ncbi:MAG: glycosyltransferase family 1 protein [Aureispira sp.]|nr:glycosyltransferase family 1 protein [Aureispira sp.]